MEQQEVKPFYKKRWFIVFAVILGIIFISTLGDSPSPSPSVTNTEPEPQQVAPSISKEDAQKEFDRLMQMSKDAGLVKSYEITADAPLKIYADKMWYSQDVQFKKDMLAKFSTLQQAMYGRHRLEVRDAYSNEKLGEITAFSGSIEIYK